MKVVYIFVLLLAALGAQAQVVGIHDEDFSNWTLISGGGSGLLSLTALREVGTGLGGGNTREIIASGTSAFTYEAHSYGPSAYDPSVYGPIAAIAWQLWNQVPNTADVATMELAALQGDSEYIASNTRYEPPLFPYAFWQEAHGSVAGSDFAKLSGSGPSKLDFSPSGQPIHFGYVNYVGFRHNFTQMRHRVSFFDLQIQPEAAHDVSAAVQVTRSVFVYDRAARQYMQRVTLANGGTTTVAAAVSLVLSGLSNATLSNTTGITAALLPAGRPYISTRVSLAAGTSTTLTLRFNKTGAGPITYSTQVAAGLGAR